MKHADRVEAFEERHPTPKKKEYLTHQPEGNATKKIQKGWEELHPSGLTDAPERDEERRRND